MVFGSNHQESREIHGFNEKGRAKEINHDFNPNTTSRFREEPTDSTIQRGDFVEHDAYTALHRIDLNRITDEKAPDFLDKALVNKVT